MTDGNSIEIESNLTVLSQKTISFDRRRKQKWSGL